MNNKLISADDRLDIIELCSRYFTTTDDRDVDGFMNLWVEGPEFRGLDSGVLGNVKTREELRAFEAHHVQEGGMANGHRHMCLNVSMVAISEREVHVTSDMQVLRVDVPPHIRATGRYQDSVVIKAADGWRFAHRQLQMDEGFLKAMSQEAETASSTATVG